MGTETIGDGAELHALNEMPDHVMDAMSQLRQQKVDQEALAEALSFELAQARSNPLRVIGELLLFRVLSILSRQSPPLSAKIAARAERKSLKLHPLRTLPGGIPDTNAGDVSNKLATAKSAQVRAGRSFDPQRSTIMLVTHEASRSGAPILALNIGRILAEKYNVVTVTLGGGALRQEFRDISTSTYELEKRVMSSQKVSALIRSICAAHSLHFAIINSVESRSVLPALKAAQVPTTILLHEFASYTKPHGAMSEVFEIADQIVFSTRITLENALGSMGLRRGTKMIVLPQGKCVVPLGPTTDAQRSAEIAWLDSVLRPSGLMASDTFLVIGAGSVEARKGVDLFIECATRVIRSAGGGRFRFVWIGHGYRPDKDKLESAFLADQLARAGIETQVKIVRSTSEIEHAYRAADMLLLSSRLDPLPNVAIDALTAGTPVVCFERTTGIADFLFDAGLGRACVAQYMDPGDMASKILAMASDQSLHGQIKRDGQTAALHAFNLEDYVKRLDLIALEFVPVERQVEQDLEYLLQSGVFDREFYWRLDKDNETRDEAQTIRSYLMASRTGNGMRKPCASFNPMIYADANLTRSAVDPFAHFLRSGCLDGPWRFPIIDRQTLAQPATAVGAKVAIHIHVRDILAVGQILARLEKNETHADLYFSTVESLEVELSEQLIKLDVQAKPIVMPCHVGPLGAILLPPFEFLLRDYDIIGQFQLPASQSATRTLEYAYESLLGGSSDVAMMDRVISAMMDQRDLGLVIPAVPELTTWGKSRAVADFFAQRIGIDRMPNMIESPSECMFWMRRSVLTQGSQLKLTVDDFPVIEQEDGSSLVAALPKLFYVLSSSQGLRTGVANVGS